VSSISVEFGEMLRGMRKKKGLTLVELAKLSGVSQPYLSHIENGKRGIPSPEILKKISTPLEVDYYQLLTASGVIQGVGHFDEYFIVYLHDIYENFEITFKYVDDEIKSEKKKLLDDKIEQFKHDVKEKTYVHKQGQDAYISDFEHYLINEVGLDSKLKPFNERAISLETILSNEVTVTINGHYLTDEEKKVILNYAKFLKFLSNEDND